MYWHLFRNRKNRGHLRVVHDPGIAHVRIVLWSPSTAPEASKDWLAEASRCRPFVHFQTFPSQFLLVFNLGGKKTVAFHLPNKTMLKNKHLKNKPCFRKLFAKKPTYSLDVFFLQNRPFHPFFSSRSVWVTSSSLVAQWCDQPCNHLCLKWIEAQRPGRGFSLDFPSLGFMADQPTPPPNKP